MSSELIDGAAIAAEIRGELKQRVEALASAGRSLKLVAVIAGDDPASHTYVRNKRSACAEAGIDSETLELPSSVTQHELIAEVERLNADPSVTAMIVQLPLPEQIDANAVMAAIDPHKDADGLHPHNLGLLLRGTPHTVPATPVGVQEMLLRSGHDPGGRRVVIVGRSTLVGRPLAMLLLNKAEGANATVTIAHTGTRDLASVTREAEILVVAAGWPNTITAEMVRPGAVVIDVGTNRIDAPERKRGWRLVGDVDFDAVSQVASAISPVPGGVGPMTIAMLLVNTLRAGGG